MIENRLKRIETESVTERTLQEIRKAISTGLLKPGQVVREVELARQLEVSQAPVREALAELANLDLVVRKGRKGIEIMNLTRRDLEERIDLRVALETLAFELAARVFNADDFAHLHAMVTRVESQEPGIDMAFHEYIWSRSGNEILKRELARVSCCLFEFAGLLRKAGLQVPAERAKFHVTLIDALKDGVEVKADRAHKTLAKQKFEHAVREHLDTAYREFFVRNIPDFKTLAEASTEG